MTAGNFNTACFEDAKSAPCFGYANNTVGGTTFVVSVFVDAIITILGRIWGHLPILLCVGAQ